MGRDPNPITDPGTIPSLTATPHLDPLEPPSARLEESSRTRFDIFFFSFIMKKRITLQGFLEQVIEDDPQGIRAEVAEFALLRQCEGDDPEEAINGFFTDLFRCGCVSGMVGGLIYYHDTHAFFDRHYQEIEELREEYEEMCGEPLRIEYNLKNHLAWFGFEWVAQQLYNEYETARDEEVSE